MTVDIIAFILAGITLYAAYLLWDSDRVFAVVAALIAVLMLISLTAVHLVYVDRDLQPISYVPPRS